MPRVYTCLNKLSFGCYYAQINVFQDHLNDQHRICQNFQNKEYRYKTLCEKKEIKYLSPDLAPLTAESCNWLKDFLMIKSGFQNCNFYWTGF